MTSVASAGLVYHSRYAESACCLLESNKPSVALSLVSSRRMLKRMFASAHMWQARSLKRAASSTVAHPPTYSELHPHTHPHTHSDAPPRTSALRPFCVRFTAKAISSGVFRRSCRGAFNTRWQVEAQATTCCSDEKVDWLTGIGWAALCARWSNHRRDVSTCQSLKESLLCFWPALLVLPRSRVQFRLLIRRPTRCSHLKSNTHTILESKAKSTAQHRHHQRCSTQPPLRHAPSRASASRRCAGCTPCT